MNMSRKLIIGSRGSDLALWQANFVFNELKQLGESVEIKIITTQGDKIQNLSLDKLEGKGFFTKEIEDALLAKEIDIAVHSHKDLPTTSPEGLVIGAVSYREDPSELLLINTSSVDEKLKLGFKLNALVGTSSARRKSQLLAVRSDSIIKDIRGNVPTRIQKLRNGEFDAILLAAAGVFRLNLDLSDFLVIKLDPNVFVPSPAQGVLALQTRNDDQHVLEILSKLNHQNVAEEIGVERKILNLFEGGCHLPLGAYCFRKNGIFCTRVSMAESWNKLPIRVYFESPSVAGFAEHITNKIKTIKPKSVFITRNLDECASLFDTLTAHKFNLLGKSLIEVSPLNYVYSPGSDWLFFSSKNAVKHFFSQNPELTATIKIAAIGEVTAGAIKKFNRKVDFIGEGNDTSQIGKTFASYIKGESVLFPVSKNSLRTIQKQFGASTNIIDLPVYEVNSIEDRAIPEADVVLFTSPSNVEAYLKNKQIKDTQKLIVVGTSTGSKLESFGFNNYTVANSFEEYGLLEAIFSL
jgi:hydroxymethylbilane synthase